MRRAAELSQLLEMLVQQLVALGRLISGPAAILTDVVRFERRKSAG
jgi:hypothetical protein